MKSCPHLADVEELVLGELDAAPAARLLEHVASCADCRDELAMVRAERALFTRRAEMTREPLPPLAPPRRFAPVTGALGLLRRGHATVACAAALFVVAAFSRASGPPLMGAASISADDDPTKAGMLASFQAFAHEPLACSPGSAPMSHDDGAMSSSSTFAASRSDALACGATGDGARASIGCEPFVTCSWLRQ